MKRSRGYLALPFLAACASFAACSSDPEPSADLGTRLEKDTGVAWTVYVDPRSSEVRFLAPASPVRIGGGTPDENARAFFAHYRESLHASGKPDELRPVSATTDARGGLHLRYEHVLPGTELRVFDSGTTAHFTADGALIWLQTDFHADLESVDPAPMEPREAAIGTAIAYLQASCGAMTGTPVVGTHELGVLAGEEGKPTLVYRSTLDTKSERCTAPTVFVDARTGAPLRLEERVHDVQGLVRGSRAQLINEAGDVKTIDVSVDPASKTPKYLMVTETATPKEQKVRTHAYPSASVIASHNVVDWDVSSNAKGAAVDAHYYTTKALEFMRPLGNGFQAHDRFPTVPLALDINVWVHYNEGPSHGENAFAYFDEATKRDIIRFGDGNPARVKNGLPFSAAFDVVAHEMGHLVTAHTSKLKYEHESGALNEAFSDVMGASAEHWLNPSEKDNLVIGEKLYYARSDGSAVALRDMDSPSVFGQPSHVDSMKTCAPKEKPDPVKNDYCGVHGNSGIANKAFALMVKGGTVVDKQNTVIGVPRGIGWEKATEAWYWATTGLHASAGFRNAAFAQIAEAGRFSVADGFMVGCAWYAVGVLQVLTEVDRLFVTTQCTAPPASPVPPAPPPSPSPPNPLTVCAGHGDDTICDPANPAGAAICRGGFLVGTAACADTSQRCRSKSASDPTATLGPEGDLICD